MRVEPLKVQYWLTDEDKIAYGQKLPELDKQLKALDKEKKNSDAKFKADKAKIQDEYDKILTALDDGWFYKSFSGSKRKNYATGEWEYLNEVGQVVERKPFGPSDFQMTTEDVEAGDDNEYDDGEGTDVDLDAMKENIMSDVTEEEDPEQDGMADIQSISSEDSAVTIETIEEETSSVPKVEGDYIDVVIPSVEYEQRLNIPDEPAKVPARKSGSKTKPK